MAERGWERRIDLPTLPEALVRATVSAHVPGAVTSLEALPDGKVNAHVRVHLDDGSSVVLRIYLREPEVAAKEAALLTHFQGALPVPAILGRGTCALPDGARPYLLLAWVPGTTLDHLFPVLDAQGLRRAGRETGAAMACVHAVRRPQLGFLDATLQVPEPMGVLPDVWAGYLGELMAKPVVAARLGPERLATCAQLLEEGRERLAAVDGVFSLLHADCKPVNVRARRTGEVTGLLDWEFAWSGPPLFDWGQMLRWPLPQAFEQGLIEGYERAGGGRPLDGAGRRTAALLDVMNLVAFLDTPREDERERAARDALALLDGTLG
ncbi:MAG: aminoglycoside phosphotransferase family protein [Planctomycetota bacterium]|nr:aminoglycoside phosphotransferase family protein [Planctomycetota bacterium]